ncbi:MAG: hypothetical protein E7672_01640 [Ruminococcaceae bacterium]|nr:hypothetical protein [Oscillospiraceae bacterium]
MKKILALLIAAMMLLTLVACNNTNEETKDNANNDQNESVNDSDKEQDNVPAGPSKAELAANASLEEIAKAVMNKYAEFAGMETTYNEYMADMPEEEKIPYEEFLSYQLSVAPVEDGAEWLMGFSEAPTGYSEAYCYQPMMMGQAFIGYIFRVAEGTDVEAFKTSLKDTCDPRWNICTIANTTVCENYENIVYFSMMVVIDDENPHGFTEEQKNDFYNTFVEVIENSAE